MAEQEPGNGQAQSDLRPFPDWPAPGADVDQFCQRQADMGEKRAIEKDLTGRIARHHFLPFQHVLHGGKRKMAKRMVDVVKERIVDVLTCCPSVPPDQFGLYGLEEGLNGSIVAAVSSTAHGHFEAYFTQPLMIIM